MKKFDYIIMNPPYKRNLHLKILEQALTFKKEDGTLINLSPIRWLQDPLAEYKKGSDWKKFENSISKKISNLDIISKDNAASIFNIKVSFNLGIYCFNNKDHWNYNSLRFIKDDQLPYNFKTIFEKINKYKEKWDAVIEKNKINGWRARVYFIKLRWDFDPRHGSIDSNFTLYHKESYDIVMNNLPDIFYNGYNNGKYWTEFGNKNQFTKNIGEPFTMSILFNTETEAKNFENFCKLNFMWYCNYMTKVDMHVHFEFFPWLGNAINPRTHMKGYTGEWTDEDLYSYFEITEDEKFIIKATIEKYGS